LIAYVLAGILADDFFSVFLLFFCFWGSRICFVLFCFVILDSDCFDVCRELVACEEIGIVWTSVVVVVAVLMIGSWVFG
jgi:hypothetical protein